MPEKGVVCMCACARVAPVQKHSDLPPFVSIQYQLGFSLFVFLLLLLSFRSLSFG